MKKIPREKRIEESRKHFYKDIIHWNGRNASIRGFNGFYGWLDWLCWRRGDWYHCVVTQPVRDIYKMAPHYDCMFDNVKDDTLVLIKKSSKRTDYLDEQQWKDIIDFIRDHNTSRIIKKIFFCTYDHIPVKIRDKEWKFIEDCGCDYVQDLTSEIWSYDEYRKVEGLHRNITGKLFTIKK